MTKIVFCLPRMSVLSVEGRKLSHQVEWSKASVDVQSAEGQSRGTQEPGERGFLCELVPADLLRPGPGEWSVVFQAEGTACAKAQRPPRAWQSTTNRTRRISIVENLADIPV